MAPRVPRLLGYRTWYDDTLLYVALWQEDLPEEALAAGCLRQVRAADELTFRQVAVRNRIRIEDWLSRQRLMAHAGEIRKPVGKTPVRSADAGCGWFPLFRLEGRGSGAACGR